VRKIFARFCCCRCCFVLIVLIVLGGFSAFKINSLQRQLREICCELREICCELREICCELREICCELREICCELREICCRMSKIQLSGAFFIGFDSKKPIVHNKFPIVHIFLYLKINKLKLTKRNLL
jgi:hypothetical protein